MLDCQADLNQPPHEAAAEVITHLQAADPSSAVPPSERKEKRKRLGFRETIQQAKADKRNQVGPDPWLVRKLAVGIVVGVYGYSYYVFVARLAVPMVRVERGRLGTKAQGVAYLVVYHLLFVLFVWSYWKAITTGPGFARDYVQQSDPPKEQCELVQVVPQRFEDLPQSPRERERHARPETPLSTHSDLAKLEAGSGTRFHPEEEAEMKEEKKGHAGPPEAAGEREKHANISEKGPLAESDDHHTTEAASPAESTSGTTVVSHTPASALETFPIAFPPKSHARGPKSSTATTDGPRPSDASGSFMHFPPPPTDYTPHPARPPVERIPPRVPILTDEYRYDYREGFLRPYRSHRCRHCAAVVLKQDHHCPWVGSCVGARNYKFFFNFLQASTVYTLFVLITMVVGVTWPTHDSSRAYPAVDGHKVAIAAVAFLFSFFTGSLLAAHTRLILLNVTTIEDLAINRIKARERSQLQFAHGWFDFKGRKKTKAFWNEEWGRVGRELNPWWLGSRRANFEMVMGQNKLGWFLPIEARPGGDDGLSYVPNPRFSPEGYPRKRTEWPAHLR